MNIASREPMLEAWELVSRNACSDELVADLLRLVRESLPIQSLLLVGFDPNARCAIRLAAAGPGAVLADRGPQPCSPAKWQELAVWSASAELLRQSSPRRSGKLAFLTPKSCDGESLAIPLDGVGAAVMEIDRGRVVGRDRDALISCWAGPLALALRNALPSQRRTGSTTKPLESSDGGDRKALREVIVGAEAGLRAVLERVQLVASSDMPVLILGDTGTGKEVVARAIHARSTRSAQPFLRVNCGAIPTELIDSQLFGHERGSFTGASDQRKGWFERADGGTLFLDEIGELPLAAQVRLLRVLQEKQIERVGGQEAIHVDVRIVAATHRDLAAMVHERTFREDLWYRINMFPILLPRLCERTEDIPALVRHFAAKAAMSFGIPHVEPTSSDIDRLIEYPWPGNIRELQAVLDRAVILGRGVKLDIATALGIGISQRYVPAAESNEPTFYEVIPESISSPPLPASSVAASPEDKRIEPLDEAIKRHIERALIACHGQVEGKRGASHLLRINPHTLRAKMRKLGIRWADFRSD